MSIHMKKISLFLTFLGLMACGKSPQDNPVLVEANQIHLEAIEVQEQVEGQLKNLDSLKNTLQDKTLKAKIDSMQQIFQSWEAALVEIEGFEHEQHEGHHHHHQPAPNMTDESMLEYQKNAKKAIQDFKKNLEDLTQQIKK
jgi:hypothetical protein